MVSLYTKQDVVHVGYILIEECSITDNEFKTYLSNESDFTSKLMFYLKSDSIFLIQELYNFLRFTLPDLGIHHFKLL